MQRPTSFLFKNIRLHLKDYYAKGQKKNFYSTFPINNFARHTVDTLKKNGNIKYIFKAISAVISGTVALNWIHCNQYPLGALKGKSYKPTIDKADELYGQMKFEELYDLLIVEKDSINDEILWRLARAVYEKARKVQKDDEKKALFAEALRYLDEANEINQSNFAVHKWLAIIMDCYYTTEGTKARISHLYDMKDHMEKACELKPKDGTSWYVLGMWYFGIANIAWYERKVAALFFATPPSATYQDALNVFLEAERVEPGFYSQNYLMMGKCLYYLGLKDEAKENFLKAKNYVGSTKDDVEARTEAEKWLSGLH